MPASVVGQCTVDNAIAGAVQLDLMNQNQMTAFTPSRLFIYYNERVIEGTVNSDSGAQIRDGIKSMARGLPRNRVALHYCQVCCQATC